MGLKAQKEHQPLYIDGGDATNNFVDIYVEGAGHDYVLKDGIFGPLSPETLKRRVNRTTRLMKYRADFREGKRQGIADMIKVLFKDS